MTYPLATLFVLLLTTYLGFGAAFAAAFVVRGVDRIDPMAKGSGWGFRLLIMPGSTLLWPLLLVRWASGSIEPPVEANTHRRQARRRP